MNSKINVFLDLDNTIICSELYTEELMKKILNDNLDYDFIESFITVERPFLQQFLDFLFKNCNVGIWTAGSKKYASFIFNRFIKNYNANRTLKLLLFNEHCDMSIKHKGGRKNLNMLWDVWNLKEFNEKNTYIIDDLKDIYDIQPLNCLKIKPYKIKPINSRNDKVLLDIIPQIQMLKDRL